MANNDIRDCCNTPISYIHDTHGPIVIGPHAFSHVSGAAAFTVHCRCGTTFTADDERDARAAHTRHAVDLTNGEPDTLDMSPTTEVFDATTPPGITQLPAVTTNMTPAQFKEWLAADGTLFMVILPANRTFVIKVPTAHHEFFVAMMQQVRFALGPEVQAVRMNMVTGPPADVDAATGTADDAPQWAQPGVDHEPPPTDTLCAHHIPPGDCITCGPLREPAPPEKHEYTSRPTADENDPPTHCPHGLRIGIGRYCADCDTSPIKYGPGAVPCPSRSSAGRVCIHPLGHGNPRRHEDSHGWTWLRDGDMAVRPS